ncbi:hypothetical protein COCON_G00119020 [Conger conger]|uniref:Tetraspanin n=1 Tax=Conger conger TaxID=82655 RepID=A0A9Q1DH56_CONCO|nr:tetraspanin-6-like [Conger conger]KAJ8269295.1 hypothetical protein COCON_G00119020 [Conger conger]
MAQENSSLKRLCITFTVLYGILGCITLTIGILASLSDEAKDFDNSSGIVLCYVFGSIIILVALLGAYATCKEKLWALRVYNVFLVLHTMGCIRGLIVLNSFHNETNNLEAELRQLTPLNTADHKIQKALNKMQTVLECCGLLGYEDWGDSVPETCHCPPDYEDRASKCRSVELPRNSWTYLDRSKVEVYKEPCGHFILNYIKMGARLLVGLCVTFTIVVVFSTIVHLMLTYQIKNRPATATFCEAPNPLQNTYLHKGSVY